MMYEILFSRKAAEFTRDLPKAHREKLKNIIGGMKNNPFSHPYRKIRGKTNLYRIRLGKYRMLYEVNEEQKRVVILKLDMRSKIYNR
jgi:mRNA interferase RelE/StbE